MLRSITCCLLSISLATSSIATAAAERAHTRQQRVAAIIGDHQGLSSPGCATAIFDHHRRMTFIVGTADIGTQRPIDADTIFYAGSVSKQFTAIAIAQLAVAGKLRLDDDVRKWLPELHIYGAPIKVAMLIHHVAGIRDVLSLMTLAGQPDISKVSRAQALQMLFRQQDTNSVPGTRFEYSNGGYLLLSEIVARASGKPFSSYVNEAILQPLGMARSRMLDGVRIADTNVARGYALVGTQQASRDNFPLFGGSGGLTTTLNDLARYDDDVTYRHKIWTPEIARILLAKAYYADGKPIIRPTTGQYYAGALIIGPQWIWHGGASAGFKTIYARMPGRELRIAMLCNRGEIDPLARADAIVKAFDETLPLVSDRVVPLVRIAGRYASDELSTVFTITGDGDTLSLIRQLQSGDARPTEPLALTRTADTVYSGGGLRLVFDDDARGVVVEQSRMTIRLHRMD